MKVLDRYILGQFLKNYLISFMVLIGLYVVLDMVFNFDDLAAVQSRTGLGAFESTMLLLRNIVSHYGFHIFLFFAHLSGIIPVVAAAFTLMRLSRFNELTAVLAAGVPLLRLAMPVILAAVGLNVLLLVNQELIIPQMIPELMRRHRDFHQDGGPSFQVRALLSEDNTVVNAAMYYPPGRTSPARMEELDVVYLDEAHNAVAHLQARAAQWDERQRQWDLVDGRIVRGLHPDQQRTPEEAVAVFTGNVTPHEIVLHHRGRTIQLLSTAQINEMLERQSYGRIDLLRVKHARFTQPLANVILLLLAVACILTPDPTALKRAAARCLMLAGLFLGSIFIAHQLAGQPPLGGQWAETWPAIMAWMPLLIFGPIAVWLLDRVST